MGLQKWPNRLSCHLGCGLGWAQVWNWICLREGALLGATYLCMFRRIGGRRTQRYSQFGSSSAAFGYQYCREWNCCDSMCLPGSTDRVQPGLLEPLLFPLSSVGRGGGAESGVDATGWWGAGRQGSRRLGWRFLPLQHCFNINSIVYLPSVLWRCWLGGRKGIRPVKNWVVGCWCCYLSGARCRLAYFPADSTATHSLLLQ